jgi:hypothetical protein
LPKYGKNNNVYKNCCKKVAIIWGILLQFARDWEKIIERYFTPITRDWEKIRENFTPITRDWEKIIKNNLCQMCRPFYIIFTLFY